MLKALTSLLLIGILFIPALAQAKATNTATIGISVVIPERAENQKCTVGFENSLNNQFIAMQNSGCLYNSKKLLQTAHQQATKTNSQGFVTVVITAP